MSATHALVVDDSKSARLILKKMLEKLGLTADTAESAEEALDYLQHHLPDVIFMDHMMPGMDGFQAVKAIKAEPRTAAIPTVMYTSREGEDYLREAQALGAAGVLSKSAKMPELLAALQALQLAAEPDATAPVTAVAADEPLPIDENILELAHEAAEEAVQRALRRQQDSERRYLRQDIERSVAAGIERVFPSEHMAEEATPARRSHWPLALAALLLIAAVPLGYRLWEPSAPSAGPATAAPAAAPQAGGVDTSQLLRQIALQRLRAEKEKKALLNTITWAVNRSGHYTFGQEPFGDQRLAMLNELIGRLSAAGFRGSVRLESHVGRFCLVRNDSDELRLPAPTSSMRRCDLLERDTAVNLGRRQSVAFANFLAGAANPGRNGIRVEVVSWGDEKPLVEYPPLGSVANAGEWNATAERNHRVEISLVPTP